MDPLSAKFHLTILKNQLLKKLMIFTPIQILICALNLSITLWAQVQVKQLPEITRMMEGILLCFLKDLQSAARVEVIHGDYQ
jgi:nitrogen fixation-related uncharacterized protein